MQDGPAAVAGGIVATAEMLAPFGPAAGRALDVGSRLLQPRLVLWLMQVLFWVFVRLLMWPQRLDRGGWNPRC